MRLKNNIHFFSSLIPTYYVLRKGFFKKDSIPILLYHDVSDNFYWSFSRATPELFRRQMRALSKKGYKSVLLDSVFKAESKRLFFSLTFDDGFKSILNNALPILKDNGFIGSVFIVTAYMGKKSSWDVNIGGLYKLHMNWDDIFKLKDAGWEIGSHSHKHRDLTKISKAEVIDDINKSAAIMEKELGQKPMYFSYPFGRKNREISKIVKNAGFHAGFTSYPDRNDVIERFAVGRRPVYLFDTSQDVIARVEKSTWKNIPYDIIGRSINFFAGGVGLVKEKFNLL